IFVLAFTDHVTVIVPPTTDHAQVIKNLGQLHAWGRTALYDSVSQGLHTISQNCAKTKALVLMTDGMDTASMSSQAQASKIAQQTKVPIFSIGIGNPNSAPMVIGISSYTASGGYWGWE